MVPRIAAKAIPNERANTVRNIVYPPRDFLDAHSAQLAAQNDPKRAGLFCRAPWHFLSGDAGGKANQFQ
jgi:hypothetical protein